MQVRGAVPDPRSNPKKPKKSWGRSRVTTVREKTWLAKEAQKFRGIEDRKKGNVIAGSLEKVDVKKLGSKFCVN